MILILFGVLCLAIGFWGLHSRRKFFKHAIVVPGVICEYKSYQKRVPRGREVTMYQAVVSFEFDGQSRTLTDAWASSVKPQVGKQCQVGVNPNNVEDARIDSKGGTVFYWVFIGFGVIGLLMGIFG